MRPVVVLPLLLLAAIASPATVEARPRATSFFLAADPHVPLAVVRNGKVAHAVSPSSRGKSCGAKKRWATIGSEWRALDEWGQVLGVDKVTAGDPYDVTACTELAFARPHNDTHVYVSVSSTWTPSASTRVTPTQAESAAFEAIVAKTIPVASSQAYVPTQCQAIASQRRFFVDRIGRRFAVGTSNSGFVVANLASGAIVASSRGATCFRPVAIFDMDGDGLPEIVLRESEGASWGELVLSVDANGRYRDVADSPGGATA
jgi:hypothetical protein